MANCNCGIGASIPGFGTPGATFIPKVAETADAVQLSWENNRGLPNPEPITIPRGKDGLSAYEVAKANGFEGTEAEWLASLAGDPGKSAYEYAVTGGYTGTEEEFAAKLAEEYPTPDWNAAEGEPGHVLNRTHWTEQNGIEEIVPETTLTTTEESAGIFLVPDGVFTLEVGKTYIATYNGTEYTCVAVDGSELSSDVPAGAAVIGNYSAAIGTGDTGEPFVAIYVPGEGSQILDFTGALSITVAVSCVDETVHKLDKKYLPEDIGGVINATPYVLKGVGEGVANLTSGGSYMSAVADGGIWKQLKKGIIAFTFMHESEDGTENVTATVNMLAGEVFTEGSYTMCLAYGLYEHRLSGSTTLYLARAALTANAGNESAGALVTFNITPIRLFGGANDVFRYPVVYDEGFIPYRIYVDANGALAVKKLTE